MKTTQHQKISLGEAGELLVASRVLSHGLITGQLPRGYKSDDLYVERGYEIVHIQVKTRQGPKSWPVGTVEVRPNRYYGLVHFASLETEHLIHPTVYLLPSKVVAKAVELHSSLYLAAHPNQQGRGVPKVADTWRMNEDMTKHGFGTGWLEKYREPWDRFVAGKLT